MNVLEQTSVPLDVAIDLQAVADSLANGKPLDAETYRRVRARGRQLTDELRERFGTLDIAVPAIRELRGELPEFG